jgi:hypothetical protein
MVKKQSDDGFTTGGIKCGCRGFFFAADRSFYNRLGIFYGSHMLRTNRLEDVIAETEGFISTLDAAIAARGIAPPKASK